MPWLAKNRLWLLIVTGTLLWSLTIVKSGWIYSYGMGFWGANGHDGIWHISLIESLSRGSLAMPMFSGETIKNYHLGFDLILAGLHRLTNIPVVNLYFQIAPPILAALIGWLTYRLTRNLWSVFFVYFGGNWAWILGRGESTFWSQASISTLINPPYALSLVVILVGLILLDKKRYLLAGLIFGFLVQIKIYAAILIIVGLGVAAIKNRHLFKTLIATLLISLPLYLVTNRQSVALIVFQPGWFLETMMALSDRLNWPRFYAAMTNYRAAGNWLKAIAAYAVALVIFVLGNLGTRLIFLARKLNLFYTTIIVLGVILPMLFLQSGTPWNTIQFFYYSLFFTSLLAGEYLKIGNWKLKIVIVLLTLPTTLITLHDIYLPARPPAMVSSSELEALQFLRSQPLGVVLTPVVNPDAFAPPPRPLYLYESTAYVSALSGQPVYMEDEVNLNITNFAWPARRQAILNLFSQTDPQAATAWLESQRIKYLYLPQVAFVRPLLSETALGMTKLFENSQVAIWSKK